MRVIMNILKLQSREGLAVVWDGERISIGNSTERNRHVVLTWTPGFQGERRPAPSMTVENADGDTTIIDYSATDKWSYTVSEHEVTLAVKLPKAGIVMGRLAVPTSMATFDYIPVDTVFSLQNLPAL
jgi:hypothetical protein